MLLALHYIILFLVLALFVPVIVFLVQVLASFFSKNNQPTQTITNRPTLAILMPAHNEALVIEESIRNIRSQLNSNDQFIVVADNCSDDTAKIAINHGAKVLERKNMIARGKGYALDYGLQYLKSSPPEVVIIIDADCLVGANSINLLAAECVKVKRPVQALYLMEPQPNPSLKARIAAFAWHVKNKVRPMGFHALGLPCQLMGTGMAFQWDDIDQVSLASGHIVEDMKLGADLARQNKAPVFLQTALVTSIFPPSDSATKTQRARWEHGHLSVILNELPKLMLDAIRNKNKQMLGLACDLLVPPIAMLTLLCLITLVLSILFGDDINRVLAFALVASLVFSVLTAWLGYGRKIISFKQLCYAPIYALIKIPLYLKFIFNRQVEWVRSKRD
ncbi:MAG TPA: glycosyltransferase family 2 protein [Methylophilaceae bacterium]|nr:glycosyltransferase family 2 protein [Methylophilaceae bacterium]